MFIAEDQRVSRSLPQEDGGIHDRLQAERMSGLESYLESFGMPSFQIVAFETVPNSSAKQESVFQV